MEEKKNEFEEMKKKLFYEPKKVYDAMTPEDIVQMRSYAEGYMCFLDSAKTERDAVRYGIEMAEAEGYREYNFGDAIAPGGKYYLNNRGKALYVFAIGSAPLERGLRIMAAHIDSPRLDIKPNPLFEAGDIAYLKTHYYGGIKKYQWPTVPLALHGTVTLKDGRTLDVCIGEEEGDPIFYVTDLLIHLAKDQMAKTAKDVISGEMLNVIIGSVPYLDGEGKDRVKLHVLALLNEKYGITEADLLSAELSAVPADKSRYIGLDRGLIGGYGHDDKVCAYPELTGFFASRHNVNSAMVILADKEETGSNGVSGMQSQAFGDLITEICRQLGANEAQVRAASKCLSADVSAAYDPSFPEVFEEKNSAFINGGVVINKYTGSGGKAGTSDASGEYLGWVRKLFEENGIVWQLAELGKVDQGGGGTVAKFIAQKNIDTIDVGVPVLSMHAPYEAIAVADLYMTHLAFAAFAES